MGERRSAATSARWLAGGLLGLWACVAYVLWPRVRVVERQSCVPVERVLWAPRVVTAASGLAAALLHVDVRGKLRAVEPASRAQAEAYATEHALPFEPHDGLTISPGVVDVRVQLAPLGRSWEGYAHGTRAAVAGGVTTVVDGPFGSVPPATSKHALQLHMRAAATDLLYANVGFLAGLTPAAARNPLELFALAAAGPLGFYAVLSPMHDEAGAQPLDAAALRAAAEPIWRTGAPLLVRAELAADEEVARVLGEALFALEAERADPLTHLRTRRAEWQTAGLAVLADLVGDVPALRLHAAAVARADDATREQLLRARDRGGARFTADVGAAHLSFDALDPLGRHEAQGRAGDRRRGESSRPLGAAARGRA